jgi:hypothetical protein
MSHGVKDRVRAGLRLAEPEEFCDSLLSQHGQRRASTEGIMNKQPPAKGLAISMVPLLALLFNSSIVSAGPENAGANGTRKSDRWARCPRLNVAVPTTRKADCRARHVVGTLRAATRNAATTAISSSSASFEGGRLFAERAGVLGHCAYMSTENDPAGAPGVVVIDVSDPRIHGRPRTSTTPGGLNPHENIKVKPGARTSRARAKQRAEFRGL